MVPLCSSKTALAPFNAGSPGGSGTTRRSRCWIAPCTNSIGRSGLIPDSANLLWSLDADFRMASNGSILFTLRELSNQLAVRRSDQKFATPLQNFAAHVLSVCLPPYRTAVHVLPASLQSVPQAVRPVRPVPLRLCSESFLVWLTVIFGDLLILRRKRCSR